MRTARRIAVLSMFISGALALIKITVGLLGRSHSVVADGFESAGDVLASGIVLIGLIMAERPPDEEHPYGHGRFETVTGLVLGVMLACVGLGICYRSLSQVGKVHLTPAAYTVWPLLGSIVAKSTLSTLKFHFGRKIRSSALVADGWNDMVDILSALAALTALGLTLLNPGSFASADLYGGFAIGVIVIVTGGRIVRDTALRLADTMPEEALLHDVRRVAGDIPGVMGVEKLFARSTGLQYHVDLHLEVDPHMTVWESHEIARNVRLKLITELDWIADVLVHVEPSPLVDHPALDKPADSQHD
jgi:cation diffusion facilitator family transporter